LTTVNTDTFSILGCLFAPGINPITLAQQPLDQLQEEPLFSRIIVAIGAAQAVFFALFTGVFGILSIYEERRQWTLQRLLVSPTPPMIILLGKLLGNLVVVLAQLLLLLAALSVIASVVIGSPTFVWGGNVPALLLVTLALALCVSGLGVLIVGLARTQEQVQIAGPMVNMALGVLGGSFGFSLPQAVSQLSLIYWGVDAYQKLARGQMELAPNLLVLFGQGIVLFVVGAWLFKRRMAL
jgi:ABC-2 type transport system permease protein